MAKSSRIPQCGQYRQTFIDVSVRILKPIFCLSKPRELAERARKCGFISRLSRTTENLTGGFEQIVRTEKILTIELNTSNTGVGLGNSQFSFFTSQLLKQSTRVLPILNRVVKCTLVVVDGRLPKQS